MPGRNPLAEGFGMIALALVPDDHGHGVWTICALVKGLKPTKTFLGLSLETKCDVLLFLVERHLSREILERICETGAFDTTPGTGIALQLDVEDGCSGAMGKPTPGFWDFCCGYLAWFWGVSGVVNVNPSTSLA